VKTPPPEPRPGPGSILDHLPCRGGRGLPNCKLKRSGRANKALLGLDTVSPSHQSQPMSGLWRERQSAAAEPLHQGSSGLFVCMIVFWRLFSALQYRPPMGASHVGDVVFECVFEKQPSDRVTKTSPSPSLLSGTRGGFSVPDAGVQYSSCVWTGRFKTGPPLHQACACS
jgi:hypothetical protein